ncbi:hypothetical protein [uncultured Roseobacter sp.]|uniref:hypothetical protein n=1 Tax=uncultured Roseobacter sp. TaxID=114847 RepID=UPI0026116A96|nr:hypothetical protein [uncultured Roseobacter sp.]
MPLEKLVLILVCVLVAAGVTLWLAAILLATLQVPFAGLAFIPAGLVGYIAYRVIAERLRSAEDDHYDRIEH